MVEQEALNPYSRIVGKVVLRQLRVRNDTCDYPSKHAEYVIGCWGPWTDGNDDNSAYNGYIMHDRSLSLLFSSCSFVCFLCFFCFLRKRFDNYQDLGGGYFYTADWRRYPYQGGSTFLLDSDNAATVFADIETNGWIDIQTRAIFLEFVLYSKMIQSLSFIFIFLIADIISFDRCQFGSFYRFAMGKIRIFFFGF
jgi:hypothetical protein